MIFFIVCLLIIFGLLLLLQKRKNKRTPNSLKKQVTLEEEIQSFINRYYSYLFMLAIIVALILFCAFIIMFVPGTESGVWYNRGI